MKLMTAFAAPLLNLPAPFSRLILFHNPTVIELMGSLFLRVPPWPCIYNLHNVRGTYLGFDIEMSMKVNVCFH